MKFTLKQKDVIRALKFYVSLYYWNWSITGGYGSKIYSQNTIRSLETKGIIKDGKLTDFGKIVELE